MILDIVFEQISTELPVSFSTDDAFTVDFGEVSELLPANLPSYAGSYRVSPSFLDQTLETAGLVMNDDLTIKQIPIAEVSNNSGGVTVIIGG